VVGRELPVLPQFVIMYQVGEVVFQVLDTIIGGKFFARMNSSESSEFDYMRGGTFSSRSKVRGIVYSLEVVYECGLVVVLFSVNVQVITIWSF